MLHTENVLANYKQVLKSYSCLWIRVNQALPVSCKCVALMSSTNGPIRLRRKNCSLKRCANQQGNSSCSQSSNQFPQHDSRSFDVLPDTDPLPWVCWGQDTVKPLNFVKARLSCAQTFSPAQMIACSPKSPLKWVAMTGTVTGTVIGVIGHSEAVFSCCSPVDAPVSENTALDAWLVTAGPITGFNRVEVIVMLQIAPKAALNKKKGAEVFAVKSLEGAVRDILYCFSLSVRWGQELEFFTILFSTW